MKKQLIAITGGPCCGKTTLLNYLAGQSYSTVPEAARMIIEEQQKRGSNCLPWMDLKNFQRSVTKRVLELEHSFDDTILFCDRGLADSHAYATNGRVQTPEEVFAESPGRYNVVFVLEQLPDYRLDESRKEDRKEATKIHHAIGRAYKEFGYQTVILPVMPPEKRAAELIRIVGERL